MSNIMTLVAREIELERIRAPFADAIKTGANGRAALIQFYRLAAPQIIEAKGWTMYRITGRDCKTDSDSETGAKSAARAFIDRIAANHPVSRGGAHA